MNIIDKRKEESYQLTFYDIPAYTWFSATLIFNNEPNKQYDAMCYKRDSYGSVWIFENKHLPYDSDIKDLKFLNIEPIEVDLVVHKKKL